MDQNYNNSQNEFLWKLLANPADDAHLYAYDLQRLVNDFPQSGVLHALFAHASDDKNLRQASVYFNARALYKLINAPSTFIGVPGERIIIQNSIGSNGHYSYAAPPVDESLHSFHEENIGDNADETYLDSNNVVEEAKEESVGHGTVLHEEVPVALIDEQHLIEAAHHTTDNETVEAPVENKVEEAYEPLPLHVETAYPKLDDDFVWPPVVDIDEEAETKPAVVENVHHNHESETLVEQADPKAAEVVETTPPVAETADQAIHHEAYQAPVEEKAEEPHEATPPQVEDAYQTSEHEATQGPFEHKIEEAQEATPPPVETVYQTSDHEAVEQLLAHTTEDVQEEIAPAIENIPVENVPEETHETAPHNIPSVQQERGAVNNGPVAVEQTVETRHEETKEEEEHKTPVVEPVQVQPEKQVADDEVFDEIVGIEQINIDAAKPQAARTYTEEEKLINGAIASSDFFTFDKTFGEHKKAGQEETPAPVETSADTEHQDISKYNDEKMPYTFMWWLDKTRKEHAATYQPYIKQATAIAAANKPKKAADELQQQYFENIFHITSVEDLDKNTPPTTAPYAMKPKEHVIIERFIKEEPQIRPQSSEKIDNENKAKKSSEDRDELVTETLAAIYSDQMLYHKAIASYKKLMLKFPEKSRYFAGKIEQLEKKTN